MAEWNREVAAFTTLTIDDQAKLLHGSWCEHYTLKVVNQSVDAAGELVGVLRRGISHWHHLHIDRAETACLNATILFNPGMHFLEDSKL